MPLEIAQQFNMMKRYDSTIEFAKVLSDGLYEDPRYLPSEQEIGASLHLINMHLGLHNGDVSTIIKSEKAYFDLITSRTPSVTELPESHIVRAAVENATVQGDVEKFYWFGSVTMRAIGVKVNGVQLIEPEHRVYTNAFVPVDDIIDYKAA